LEADKFNGHVGCRSGVIRYSYLEVWKLSRVSFLDVCDYFWRATVSIEISSVVRRTKCVHGFLQIWTTIKGQSDGEEIQQDLQYYEKSSAPSDGCISGNVQSKVRAEFWHDSAIYMDGTGAAFTAFEDYCTACTASLRRFCWDYRAVLSVLS
jgi:hypothetical protein